MASLSPSTTTTTHNLSPVQRNALLSKSPHLTAYISTQNRRAPAKISCKAANNDESNKFDRRNLLIGLGGLYGAATTVTGANATLAADSATDPVVPTVVFPKPLKNIIRTNLPRPRKSRTQNEKDDEEEVLAIDVESRSDVYSKFDVYVNDEDESPTLANRTQTEYAGSFVNVPHRHGGKDGHLKMTTTVRFGLSELIDDLDANDDEGMDVIFVPRTGTDSVIIKDVRIEFQD
ncbi:hypothetical protein BVRB_8g183820 [Beta vulgaris subsp. vulgaris]|nr:hypothetical protein BVRB_8g183820 [Beta vulgaris subsp. vulgaris]